MKFPSSAGGPIPIQSFHTTVSGIYSLLPKPSSLRVEGYHGKWYKNSQLVKGRFLTMVFAIAVMLVTVLFDNNLVVWGQETQAQPSFAPLPLTTPFREKDFLQYKKKGTATISGQAFMTTKGREVRYQPGGDVMLVPESPYTRQWLEEYVRRQGFCSFITYEDNGLSKDQKECRHPYRIFALIANNERLFPYLKFTRMNPAGQFWFNKLPPGKYFLVTVITWEIGMDGPLAGGIAWAVVATEPGEQVANVMVTN